ncbi:MAG: hypothetical protein EZS28_033929 [Streblomastix strix]|uniref:CCZ1/INTU/HSP4 first Longin domain-containing protein n=1 Tax=Streblomastix strix TaxID=222440 RepID=A0A5J4UJY9_9EUKA|nr:MAG: hypothetical protein EZS28_033929 [Streblomastix strix]
MKPRLFAIFSPPPPGVSSDENHPLIHYYYSDSTDPDECKPGTQQNRVGMFLALFDLGEAVRAGTPRFLTTSKLKIACAQLNGVYFILGANFSTMEYVVTQALDLILQYFKFFYRSFDDIQVACNGNDYQTILAMKDIGTRLLSILYICFPDSATQALQPIAYVPLPYNGRQYFLDAAYLLERVSKSIEIPIYGAIITYGSSLHTAQSNSYKINPNICEFRSRIRKI